MCVIALELIHIIARPRQNPTKMQLRELIDVSIHQSLARCIFTSATTFLAILPMAIWNGHTINSFTLPMIFGIVVATTWSIFIAAPILLVLGN